MCFDRYGHHQLIKIVVEGKYRASVFWKTENMTIGIHYADHAEVGTNFADKQRSLGQTNRHGVCFVCLDHSSCCFVCFITVGYANA
jgi:hypothetical protein